MDELAESATKLLEITLQPLEERLPPTVGQLTAKAGAGPRGAVPDPPARGGLITVDAPGQRPGPARRRSPSVRPPRGEDVGERRRERDAWFPPGRAVQPGGVAPQHGHVDRTDQTGVRLELEIGAGERQELLGHLGHGDIAARADVVDRPGVPLVTSSRYAATTSRTSVKSRRVVRVPTRSERAPARWASTMRWASAGTKKLGDCPGPMWLNGRTTITGWRYPRHAWSATTSAASLLAAYGLAGAAGDSSRNGSSSGVTVP